MTPPNQPRISIVIASLVGAPFIDNCLRSVQSQAMEFDAEVIVITCGTPQYADRIQSAFPWVRVLRLPKRETVPQLRRHGIEAAQAPFVAIIEEHCTASPSWLRLALDTLEARKCAAVGGPVADGSYRRIRDWVVYFIEYNGSMPPAVDGPVTQLNGANIAYRRDVLLRNLLLLDQGYWEAVLHPALLAAGETFQSVPAMSVHHTGPFDYGYYLRQRFLFSRAFAGWRAQSLAASHCAVYLITAPILPFVLFARIAQRVLKQGGRMDRFLLAAPLILPALVVYVAGEWIGYASGPGNALYEVE